MLAVSARIGRGTWLGISSVREMRTALDTAAKCCSEAEWSSGGARLADWLTAVRGTWEPASSCCTGALLLAPRLTARSFQEVVDYAHARISRPWAKMYYFVPARRALENGFRTWVVKIEHKYSLRSGDKLRSSGNHLLCAFFFFFLFFYWLWVLDSDVPEWMRREYICFYFSDLARSPYWPSISDRLLTSALSTSSSPAIIGCIEKNPGDTFLKVLLIKSDRRGF